MKIIQVCVGAVMLLTGQTLAQVFPDAGVVTTIPARARLDVDDDGLPDQPIVGPSLHPGFCALWAKPPFRPGGLSDVQRTFNGLNPGTSFIRDLAPMVDFKTTGFFGSNSNIRIPWSSGCTVRGSDVPVEEAALVRLRGNLHIENAGIYTFVIFSDDGYSLNIGGALVSEARASPTRQGTESRRVNFEQAGVYPIEIIYGNQYSQGAFWIDLSASERCFDSLGDAGVCGGEFIDLYNRPQPPPRTYNSTSTFERLGSRRVAPATWLGVEDECLPFIGRPNQTCGAALGSLCGNGVVEFGSDGGREECDDNNTNATDGCSSSCTVERNYTCGSYQTSRCRQITKPVIETPTPGEVVGRRPNFAGKGLFGMTVSLKVDGIEACASAVDTSDRWNCAPASDLSDGPHDAGATQTDAVGATSREADVVGFTVGVVDAGTTIEPIDAGSPSAPQEPRRLQVGCTCDSGPNVGLIGCGLLLLAWFRRDRSTSL